jgi:cyanobactin maturation PatA/PatG family protease
MPKPPDAYPGYKGYPGYPAHLADAAELIWTLNVELTPVYAIRPSGGFATEAYQRLVEFFAGQIRPPKDKDWYISRVAIPGVLTGETVRLFSGQVVPVLVPQVRGMASWNVAKLITATLKALKLDPDSDEGKKIVRLLRGYLNRVYYLLRNLGQASADRAVNYTATNVVQVGGIVAEQVSQFGKPEEKRDTVLDTIAAERSPFCRIDSECWDVKITFFDPNSLLSARDQYLFTVDLREAFPVLVGPYRHFQVPR